MKTQLSCRNIISFFLRLECEKEKLFFFKDKNVEKTSFFLRKHLLTNHHLLLGAYCEQSMFYPHDFFTLITVT